jgi:exosortase B
MNAPPFSIEANLRLDRKKSIKEWVPVGLGLLILYVPTLFDMFTGTWAQSEQAHGPIILAVSIWLIWHGWGAMEAVTAESKGNHVGYMILAIGLIAYIVGRSQSIQLFEVGSLVWILTGVLVAFRGIAGLRTQWFPLFFMAFMVPLPGPVVDAVTMPMKTAVSYVVDFLLYAVDYPIARRGVIIQIGQYNLLVADACAGLHTLFTLEALGLLYLKLVRSTSVFRNVTLAVLIVPISFTANVIRVLVLTLITYHFGDEAGQGFLHGFAGMVLFISALLLIILVDSLLTRIVRWRRRQITKTLASI